MRTLGILGCGNMGAAILAAASSSGMFDCVIFDTDTQKVNQITSEYGVRAASSIKELQSSSEGILLAIKPQILPSIYPLLSELEDYPYISIAAGIELSTLEENLHSRQIVRFMPNIAASAGHSVTAYTASSGAEVDFVRSAVALAETFGSVIALEERLFSAFTGLSGSAIAYIFQFIHALASGGTRAGIPYQDAVKIAAQTMQGATALLDAGGRHPMDLLSSVTSAGGTTIAGVHALEEGAFTATVMNAVLAAAARADELS